MFGKPSLLARAAVAAVAACGALVVVFSPGSSSAYVPPDPGCGTLRTCIVNEANWQYTSGGSNRFEHPAGSNCNFYSTQWHDPGATHCANGEWAEAWCMDFAHYVYWGENANLSGLNHLAASAKTYGQTHGTWHSSPVAGDLALWSNHEHVGIVVAVSGTSVEVVSGNWNNQVSRGWFPRSTFDAFAGPVA